MIKLPDKFFLTSPEILAIVGARQTGKSTLLRQIFKTLKKVNTSLKIPKIPRSIFSFRQKYPAFKIIIASEDYYHFDKERAILFLPLFFLAEC